MYERCGILDGFKNNNSVYKGLRLLRKPQLDNSFFAVFCIVTFWSVTDVLKTWYVKLIVVFKILQSLSSQQSSDRKSIIKIFPFVNQQGLTV